MKKIILIGFCILMVLIAACNKPPEPECHTEYYGSREKNMIDVPLTKNECTNKSGPNTDCTLINWTDQHQDGWMELRWLPEYLEKGYITSYLEIYKHTN